jgi:hypothetical protein
MVQSTFSHPRRRTASSRWRGNLGRFPRVLDFNDGFQVIQPTRLPGGEHQSDLLAPFVSVRKAATGDEVVDLREVQEVFGSGFYSAFPVVNGATRRGAVPRVARLSASLSINCLIARGRS